MTTKSSSLFDAAVIGAGMAGLIGAQQLKQAGYRVVVLEKSRGVGGRMATRRLYNTFADHGACYLTPKGDRFRNFVEQLLEAGILSVWTNVVHEMGPDGHLKTPPLKDRYPRYISSDGMTAIAKYLANGLDIRLNQRVQTLASTGQYWRLIPEPTEASSLENAEILARAVLVSVPAPQAVLLLESLPETVLPSKFIHQLNAVQFTPCLSTIAGYAPEHYQDWLEQYPDVRAITFSQHSDLAWIGLDSSKRSPPTQPGFVIQSTATFAENYLDATDLQPAAQILVRSAAKQLASWLDTPDWVQIHRWRYAFACQPLPDLYLAAPTPIPLLCAGDWCGGMKVENAFLSGLAAADYLKPKLKD